MSVTMMNIMRVLMCMREGIMDMGVVVSFPLGINGFLMLMLMMSIMGVWM